MCFAESLLEESKVLVSTQLTTLGELTPAASQDPANRPGPSAPVEPSASAGIQLEGWQKFWEQPPASAQALGIATPNIKWLKSNEAYGLFDRWRRRTAPLCRTFL
ncbi:hypothetical protein PBY51_012372 [Eleginops maclovinus]|uniref:Uncharacterized protein n=1 Tax=Eleginops maclovinus TaxID=56733 RepID=A0AAN7XXF3_ELEMC|nr:hypothetical protein PBY51_012372 [Eleginops maclovinus]